MPRIIIDNSPPTAVFNDSTNLSQGEANLANSLIQAPLQVAEIRRQQQAQALDQLWKQREWDRTQHQDSLNELWHDQGQQLQQRQLDSIDGYRKDQADLHQQEAYGRGALNLLHSLGSVFGFGAGGGANARPPIYQSQAWGHALEIAKSELPRDPLTGQAAEPVKPERVQALYEGIMSGKIPMPPAAAAAPAPPPISRAPAPPPQHWWQQILGGSPSIPDSGMVSGTDFSGDDSPSIAPPAAAPSSAIGKPVMPKAILLQKAQKAGLDPAAAQQHYEQLGYQIGD